MPIIAIEDKEIMNNEVLIDAPIFWMICF